MREHRQEAGAGKTEHLGKVLQPQQRAYRVGALPLEAMMPSRGQRFGQHEIPVEEIGQAETGRNPERQPHVDAAEQATDCRPDHEAEAECRAEHAEAGSALLRRCDVGDVRVGGGDAGRGDAADDASEEEQRQRLRQRHEDVVETEAEIRQQDHPASAEAIRQCAQQRRRQELHQGEDGNEPAVHRRAFRRVREEAGDQRRQHRDDQADRQDIQRHRDEDEDQRSLARRSGGGQGIRAGRGTGRAG